MRVLIVDVSRRAMARVRRVLAEGIPDVEVTEFDADERAMPDARFDWSLYQVVLLTHEPARGQNATEWLIRYAARGDFPPALVVTPHLDVYEAVALTRAGACGVLLHADLRAERLRHEVTSIARDPVLDTVVESAAMTGIWRASQEPSGGGDDDGYQFMRLIGQGGMSKVYLAKRVRDDFLMVVKTISTDLLRSREMRARFESEAALARSIDRRHAVEIYDFGFGNNYGMIAMEFLPLGDLKRRIEAGVSSDEARTYFRQILQSIEALRAAGVVHRDIKPGNLMFRADDTLVVADFGIAKESDSAALTTTIGRVLGTPAYLSPEQARGRVTDSRSDLYSAGVILFEMLEARRPYTGPTVEAMMYQHVHAPLPKVSVENQAFQPFLDRILAKAPEERFADPSAALQALDAIGAI